MVDNQTTKLRKLLDERGIKYIESQNGFRTRFRFNYCEACGDYLDEIEIMGACITASKSYLTPEQAIDVMLGSGTCEWHEVYIGGRLEGYECECGQMLPNLPKICPNCWKKVLNGKD